MQQPEALQAASGDPRHTPYLSAAAEERSCPCSGESPPQGLDQRPVVSITDPVNRCIPSLHLLHAKENVQCAYTLQHICTLPCCMLLKAWHEAQDCSSARMALFQCSTVARLKSHRCKNECKQFLSKGTWHAHCPVIQICEDDTSVKLAVLTVALVGTTV